MGLTNMSDLFAATTETLKIKLNQNGWPPMQPSLEDQKIRRRWSSVMEGTSVNKLDAVMQEFRMNGLDSPYDPMDSNVDPSQSPGFLGLGAAGYLRQKSWPAPDSTPTSRLPHSYPTMDYNDGSSGEESSTSVDQMMLSEHQRQVLSTIPTAVLYLLLRELDKTRSFEKRHKTEVECRFCKNNGERAQFYKSHALRAAGRVTCPVLRALVCRQCGASADRAHTLKYCPLTSPAQRKQSAAMMQCLRLSNRRHKAEADYVMFGELAPDARLDGAASPLDPVWAALERKLMH